MFGKDIGERDITRIGVGNYFMSVLNVKKLRGGEEKVESQDYAV